MKLITRLQCTNRSSRCNHENQLERRGIYGAAALVTSPLRSLVTRAASLQGNRTCQDSRLARRMHRSSDSARTQIHDDYGRRPPPCTNLEHGHPPNMAGLSTSASDLTGTFVANPSRLFWRRKVPMAGHRVRFSKRPTAATAPKPTISGSDVHYLPLRPLDPLRKSNRVLATVPAEKP